MTDTATPSTPSPAPSAGTETECLEALQQALLKGLGVPHLKLERGVDETLMEELGKLLREMTQGTVDMLRIRSESKSSIHADMTMIGHREVNPLKAAWDVDIALRHLLAPGRADLMGPVAAVTDAYNDLRSHDRGLASGIEAALRSLLQRFSPEEFAKRLEGKNTIDRFLPGSRKARQWDLLVEFYDDVAREGQQDFWAIFEREFRRAYSTGQSEKRDA
jgi:FHA domain-containing protein